MRSRSSSCFTESIRGDVKWWGKKLDLDKFSQAFRNSRSVEILAEISGWYDQGLFIICLFCQWEVSNKPPCFIQWVWGQPVWVTEAQTDRAQRVSGNKGASNNPHILISAAEAQPVGWICLSVIDWNRHARLSLREHLAHSVITDFMRLMSLSWPLVIHTHSLYSFENEVEYSMALPLIRTQPDYTFSLCWESKKMLTCCNGQAPPLLWSIFGSVSLLKVLLGQNAIVLLKHFGSAVLWFLTL